MVSMKRIDKFLHADEVQKGIKSQAPQKPGMGPDDTCLKISGSFSWGFTSNKPKKDVKKGASASAQKQK